MTWEEWRWDPTLFEGTAPFYVRGRLPYAPGLADALADALGLDGVGRLLDVGCGPGIVALAVAHHFAEVVGVDPDPGMLEQAELEAADRGVDNARWVLRRAEELAEAGLGSFRAVTFGASFHWMDRPLVASIVRGLLDPGGAVVQVDAPAYRPPDEQDLSTAVRLHHPPIPTDAIEAVRVRFLGSDRRAGQSIRNTSPSGEDGVFQAAGFAPMEARVVPDGRVLDRDVEQIVALMLSSSGTAPHLFGDGLAAFIDELRSTLSAASPTGRFSVPLPDNRMRIWRPV